MRASRRRAPELRLAGRPDGRAGCHRRAAPPRSLRPALCRPLLRRAIESPAGDCQRFQSVRPAVGRGTACCPRRRAALQYDRSDPPPRDGGRVFLRCAPHGNGRVRRSRGGALLHIEWGDGHDGRGDGHDGRRRCRWVHLGWRRLRFQCGWPWAAAHPAASRSAALIEWLDGQPAAREANQELWAWGGSIRELGQPLVIVTRFLVCLKAMLPRPRTRRFEVMFL
mmetsp:Transcript_9904/g.24531  ORF Transcript_9904/g.24531 Transcript_9904/m.24531 type:complete len:224 (-) Transcript_9904:140-811(-)